MNRDIIYITCGNNPGIQKELDVKFTINVDELKTINKKDLRHRYETEDLYNLICKEIEKKLNGNIKGFLIDYELGSYDAFAITHHIRLTDSEIRILPIVITSSHKLLLDEINLNQKAYYNLFRIKAGVSFIKSDRLFQQKDAFSQKTNLMFAFESQSDFDINDYLKDLYIRQPDTTDRHQIANEWGAFKLAYEAGFDISYNIPQTLYFKYLKAKYGNFEKKKDKKPILDKKIKVLLIDDNAEKGWKEALEKVLPARVVEKTELKQVFEIPIEEFEGFDIIFLDLYMDGYKNIENSAKLAKLIKEKFPAMPIIVFTASNKIWNLRKLEDNGADGYFVKEAPENASIPGFSKDNFEHFNETVLNAVRKGKYLKPYWNRIVDAQKNFLPQIKDENGKKLKSRIIERLKMFFGLLKRGYEQTDFNEKQFFYSDKELAFITLWSVLNEIQEAYYQKSFPDHKLEIEDKNGNKISKHPNGKNITPIPGRDWMIKDQPNDYLIKNEWRFMYDNAGNIELGKDKFYKIESKKIETAIKKIKEEPFYKVEMEKSDKSNLWQKLSLQIAFLILKKNDLISNDKNELLRKLHRLNEKRNHLYLTHGESSKDFYSKTVKEKREEAASNITDKDIQDLFDLVVFLLTGNEKILL